MIPAALKSNPSSLLIPAVLTATAIVVAVYVERSRRIRKADGDDGEKEAPTSPPPVVPPQPTVAAAEGEPDSTAPIIDTPEESPESGGNNKKVVVLISSYATNANLKSNQDRALTILKGLKLRDDQMEIIDGAVAANRDKRNELFGLSGIRAKYPQFFVVDQSDATTFLADWEGFQEMNEMGSLKESINLA